MSTFKTTISDNIQSSRDILDSIKNTDGIKRIDDIVRTRQVFEDEVVESTYDDPADGGGKIGAISTTNHSVELEIKSDLGTYEARRLDATGTVLAKATYNLSTSRDYFEVREVLVRNNTTVDSPKINLLLSKYVRTTETGYVYKPYKRILNLDVSLEEDILIVELFPLCHYKRFLVKLVSLENKVFNWSFQIMVAPRRE